MRIPGGLQETLHPSETALSKPVTLRLQRPGLTLISYCGRSSSSRDDQDEFCNKTIVDVLHDDSAIAPGAGEGSIIAKTGEPAELLPLVVPTRMAIGSDLPVRIYRQGRSVPGQIVKAHAPSGRVTGAATDTIGTAVFTIDEPGRWLLRFTSREPRGVVHGELSFSVAAAMERGR